MRALFEALESRVLLTAATVTTATLAADESTIATNSAAITAEVKLLAAHNKADLAAITADLKLLPKTNAPLLATVKADLSKLASKTSSDGTAVVKPSGALVKKSVTTGDADLISFSSKNTAALAADTTALNSILVAPLGKLQLDLTGPLVNDLGPLLTANPTATQLANDIAALSAAYSADSAALTAAATQYQTSVGVLATNLSTIASTPPNILFTYTGTATQQSGAHAGKSGPVSLVVTVEAADGSWTGTITAPNSGGVPVSHLAQGSVTAAGVFTGQFSAGTGAGILLNGQVTGNTIKGTVHGTAGTGSFSVKH